MDIYNRGLNLESPIAAQLPGLQTKGIGNSTNIILTAEADQTYL